MTVLGWIVFGLIVGIVGKLLMPGKIRADSWRPSRSA